MRRNHRRFLYCAAIVLVVMTAAVILSGCAPSANADDPPPPIEFGVWPQTESGLARAWVKRDGVVTYYNLSIARLITEDEWGNTRVCWAMNSYQFDPGCETLPIPFERIRRVWR